ncbi:Target of EGR1 protein 1 [Porphyridium purpureum]|uniref:Target of EGR1 protein 1 n=1 Tax=Porphyridium purpureum TaxID=35688 RepID=A0A5J4YTK9_PORPP|nr:Target of EGR1 protein 1 [Porphyridium purpureum]|eukprot:POR8838..scf229_5
MPRTNRTAGAGAQPQMTRLQQCFCCRCEARHHRGKVNGGQAPVVCADDVKDRTTSPEMRLVTKSNAAAMFAELTAALFDPGASCVAMDVEFSGLPGAVKQQPSVSTSRTKTVENRNDRNGAGDARAVAVSQPNATQTPQTLYEQFRQDTRKYCTLSLGLAVFRKDARPPLVFDFLFCKEPEVMITTSSARFLLQHGFDLNRMFMDGIPYTEAEENTLRLPPGPSDEELNGSLGTVQGAGVLRHGDGAMDEEILPESLVAKAEALAVIAARNERRSKKREVKRQKKEQKDPVNWAPLPQGILFRIGIAKLPLVLHNGMLDLMQVVNSFEAALPETLQDFVRVVKSRVSTIFDTKLISNAIYPNAPTFLTYVFARERRLLASGGGAYPQSIDNAAIKSANCDCFRLAHVDYTAEEYADGPTKGFLCENFAMYGHCRSGVFCSFSHCLDAILRRDEAYPPGQLNGEEIQARRELRRSQATAAPTEHTQKYGHDEQPHSAGYDAFETGFVFERTRKTNPSIVNSAANQLKINAFPILMETSRYTG